MCKIMNVFGQNGRENLWIFFQAVIAVYLLILSVIDIRWKKVSVRSLLILLAIAVLCQVLCSKGELRMMVAGGLCGGVFLFFSWFTQESFGYGDINFDPWNFIWWMESSLDSVCCISDRICLRRNYDRTKEVYKKKFISIYSISDSCLSGRHDWWSLLKNIRKNT